MMDERKLQILIKTLKNDYQLPTRLANILRQRNYKNEEEFYNLYEELLTRYTSNYLFPGKLMEFYPQIKERRAKNILICDLSGAQLKPGSCYYSYHPFIEDLQSGIVYTIKKKIKTSLEYLDEFPQDLVTYEEWYYRLKNSYYVTQNNNIDFYHLSIQCGENCLEPYALGLSKKRRKI